MYSCTLSLTLAVDGGGWSTPCPSRITPRKDPVPLGGWAPGPVWTGAEYLTPSEFDLLTVQPVASLYTNYAILAHSLNLLKTKRNLLYIRNQSVPHCEHSPTQL
jgi:hypothetical protein